MFVCKSRLWYNRETILQNFESLPNLTNLPGFDSFDFNYQKASARMSSKCPADHAPADLINLVLRLALLAGVVIEDYGPVLLSAVHALAVSLVFGCIGADLCKQIRVLQHFSKSTRLSS